MERRLKLGAAFTLLALLALAGGCSEGRSERAARSGQPLVLGVSQVAGARNWDAAGAESIRLAAHAAGVELLLEDARRSQERQFAALRKFIRQRVDVIAFSPVVENGYEGILREIRSAGIPVILIDRDLEVTDQALYDSLVGSDFVEEGRRAGRWLLAQTRDRPDEMNIVELQGSVGSAPANDRKQGFAEAIAEDRRYHIIRSQSADFDRARAREVMAEFLKAEGRRIHVLFAHSDSMALGGIEAIEAAGFNPGVDILVISIEGKREALEAILAGKLNVTVECSPLFGPQLMEVVTELGAGRPVPRRVITEESVFTRENAAAGLVGRSY
jgi:simple sugar transport system substrate-binding protein